MESKFKNKKNLSNEGWRELWPPQKGGGTFFKQELGRGV